MSSLFFSLYFQNLIVFGLALAFLTCTVVLKKKVNLLVLYIMEFDISYEKICLYSRSGML